MPKDSAPPEVTIQELLFRIKHITIILEWTQENDTSYSVSIEPQAELVIAGNRSASFVVLYNTFYNVNVMAYSVCNTTIEFNYSELNL